MSGHRPFGELTRRCPRCGTDMPAQATNGGRCRDVEACAARQEGREGVGDDGVALWHALDMLDAVIADMRAETTPPTGSLANRLVHVEEVLGTLLAEHTARPRGAPRVTALVQKLAALTARVDALEDRATQHVVLRHATPDWVNLNKNTGAS